MKAYQKSIDPLMITLKPHSNGPLYSNIVIGTLAVGGWAATFGTAKKRLGGASARPGPSLLYQMLQPSMASVPTSYYSTWHYNYQCPLKGYSGKDLLKECNYQCPLKGYSGKDLLKECRSTGRWELWWRQRRLDKWMMKWIVTLS